MKNLKNLTAAFTLLVVMIMGAVSANAGILLGDRSIPVNSDPCVSNDSPTKSDTGIIVAGFTGIIVAGFTGIIVAGKDTTQVNCGILMSD
ncbi:MAG TPA: hypothetical protein VGC76_10930 [Pyrinomonadaceae bacterium]